MNIIQFLLPASDVTISASFETAPVSPPDGVLVGNVVWAHTNSIPNLGGTATFQSTPYVYDGANQITWTQATGGTSDNTAAGVCPTGWRLPTSTEYSALYSATTWTWKSSAPTGYTVSGGTGSTLFFPASGHLRGGANQGSYGYYWSSVQYPSNTSYVHYLTFHSGRVNPTDYDNMANVFSVRCVRDI